MEHAIAYLVAVNCAAQRYLVWVGSFRGKRVMWSRGEEGDAGRVINVDRSDPKALR